MADQERPDPPKTPVWEPPLAGSDAQHLAGMLDRLRYTFRWKADGLTREQLGQTLPPSMLSIGVLLKHLAVCEDDIFAWRINGEPPEAWLSALDDVDPAVWQFTLTDDDTAEQLYDLYDQSVIRSRRRMAEIIAADRLDAQAHQEWDGVHLSVRRCISDFIEELGRHTGHADLIREAVDGRVGEDPDDEWTPPAAWA
ncbi:DUF664 domain-containing protein [Propionibacteriaceae bacterium G1746]|uniref:mycothiol transferase n=1 Tax=Aestuariimicrobium sp. G57 TaxID=3418485 RepID=UPI003C231FC6